MENFVEFALLMFQTCVRVVSGFVCNHPYLTGFAIAVKLSILAVIRYDSIVRKPVPISPIEHRTVKGQQLPPNYPNGWIPILESSSIGPDQVKSVIVFGRELTVVRSANSQLYIIDSYCPHLGANLSECGTLHQNDNNDNCIRCPFHGWSFRLDDGVCSHIPYESEPAENAKLKVWRSLEINDIIFVWHHTEDEEPTWKPLVEQQILSKDLVYRCRTEHYANCHFQEIPENGADVAHLSEIHEDHFLFGSNLSWTRKFKDYSNWFGHEWSGQWSSRTEPELHMANVELLHSSRIFGMSIFEIKVVGEQIGPAYVALRFTCGLLGGFKALILQQVTPIRPLHNRIIHRIYTENNLLGWLISRFLMISEAKLLDRDIQIWNRKAFLSKPHFAKSERSLVRFRRWFNQFYTKRSIDW